MSHPIPSPSIKGIIGLFGTDKEPSLLTVIFLPFSGTFIFLNIEYI